MTTHLSIDFGKNNLGLAISEEGSLATPYRALYIKDNDYSELFAIIDTLNPQNIVVGKPSYGPVASEVDRFILFLKNKYEGLVTVYPEDNSSRKASEHQSVKSHKTSDHAIAASYILQNFLDES